MGLFSKKPASSSSMTDWLYAADKVYNYAITTHIIQGVSKYFEGNAATYILNIVNSNRKEHQGLERYRRVEFKLNTSDGTTAMYTKSVTYDNVKLQYGVSVAVGDAYQEQWTISKASGSLKVCGIKRLFA